MTPSARFWSGVDKSPGCWLWPGSTAPYGRFYIDGRLIGAHVWSFQEEYGPVPDGLVVHHKCETPACVRPDHLQAVTQRANVLASETSPAAICARRITCPRGHEYDRTDGDGYRRCRECGRERTRAWRERQRKSRDGSVEALA